MSATLPALTLAQASLFLTLCGRALDSRAPRPFLGDPTAAEILARIGYDCSRFPLPASSVTDIALRAKKLVRLITRLAARAPPSPGAAPPSCATGFRREGHRRPCRPAQPTIAARDSAGSRRF